MQPLDDGEVLLGGGQTMGPRALAQQLQYRPSNTKELRGFLEFGREFLEVEPASAASVSGGSAEKRV